MWANFKSMPILLRFLTAWAACCFVLFAMSLIPGGTFAINDQQVTFAQWWSSGAGLLASLTGILGPVAAWSLVTKRQHSRLGYLAFLAFVFVVPYFFLRTPVYALLGLLVVAAATYYFYRWPSVMAYFAP